MTRYMLFTVCAALMCGSTVSAADRDGFDVRYQQALMTVRIEAMEDTIDELSRTTERLTSLQGAVETLTETIERTAASRTKTFVEADPVASPPSAKLSAVDLPADAQPTPWFGISRALDALNVTSTDVPIDPGCGFDARSLIEAAKYTDARKFIGVEIDPVRAESARQYVRDFESSYPQHRGKIEIVTGDATKLDWKELGANIAFVYMWPDVLEDMKDQLTSMDRFVSWQHEVPGLSMKDNGRGVFTWDRRQAITAKIEYEYRNEPIYRTVDKTVMLPYGSRCEVCGGRCGSPMAHRATRVIAGYKKVKVPKEVSVPSSPKESGGRTGSPSASTDKKPAAQGQSVQYAELSTPPRSYLAFRSGRCSSGRCCRTCR